MRNVRGMPDREVFTECHPVRGASNGGLMCSIESTCQHEQTESGALPKIKPKQTHCLFARLQGEPVARHGQRSTQPGEESPNSDRESGRGGQGQRAGQRCVLPLR